MNLEKLTLAEMVTMKPETAALFEKYNLDFCCRGKQTLANALAGDPQKLSEVSKWISDIFESTSGPSVDFDQLTLAQLIDYIVDTHHRYVKENLPLIQQHLDKVSAKHGDAHPEMKTVARIFSDIKRDFEEHMLKEEIVLFPRIKRLESMLMEGNFKDENILLEDPILMMEHEHEAAGLAMEEIKNVSHQYMPPPEACTTFRLSLEELKIFEQDLHRHVHLENNILFPKALQLSEKLIHPTLT